MTFCLNCGAELPHHSADDLPATVMAGSLGAFPPQGGQNYQQPNFQQQPNYQQQNYQQPNFQPQFQTPNFQTAQAESGGNTSKILVGIGVGIIGLIFLIAGGVQLYKVFGDKPSPTPYLVTNANTGNKSNTNNIKSSNTNSSSSLRTMSDMTQQTVGEWTLRDTITGNPEKDGFSGATEEKQFKYYNSSNAMVHLTIAQYPFEYDAQKALRTAMDKFKTLKLKVGEETAMGDNDGNEIGITNTMASANGKLFTRYWTNKNFLFRALGTETEVENFVKKSER